MPAFLAAVRKGQPVHIRSPKDFSPMEIVTMPVLVYKRVEGLLQFAHAVHSATPMQLVSTERAGVSARILTDIAHHLQLPQIRVFEIVGVPKATAQRKASSNATLARAEGQRALGLARLLGEANDLLARSTSAEAAEFDVAAWLGRWLEQPQPALGGQRPADLLDTPTGLELVTRLLGAVESGSFL